MGKRELFIAIAFIVAGVVAYHMTAPPPTPGVEGFSLSRLWNNARRGMRGNAAQATLTKTGIIQASADLTELRVEGAARQLRLIGEARSDIAYELTIDSAGPDKDAALSYARQVTIKTDDLGTALSVRLGYPHEGRQSVAVVVRAPARLGVSVSGASAVETSNLASVLFDNVSGDATAAHIAGAVTGVQRNGTLAVRGAGSVKLNLQRSRASFENIEHGLTLDMRDGECRVVTSKGPVELDETRAEITIIGQNGPIRVGGADGRVTVTDPHDVTKIDVRRAEIELTLQRSVPLTLLTTDDTLRVLLDGPPRVSIDAVANIGRVRADDFGLQAESVEQESRLSHVFGGADGARVSLRNLRGDIVIKNLSGAAARPAR